MGIIVRTPHYTINYTAWHGGPEWCCPEPHPVICVGMIIMIAAVVITILGGFLLDVLS